MRDYECPGLSVDNLWRSCNYVTVDKSISALFNRHHNLYTTRWEHCTSENLVMIHRLARTSGELLPGQLKVNITNAGIVQLLLIIPLYATKNTDKISD